LHFVVHGKALHFVQVHSMVSMTGVWNLSWPWNGYTLEAYSRRCKIGFRWWILTEVDSIWAHFETNFHWKLQCT
jgi:hypothetical protein